MPESAPARSARLSVTLPAGVLGIRRLGRSRVQITNTIQQSDEYRRDLVQSYYESLLDRDADQGGLAGFVTALARGQRYEHVMAILRSLPLKCARKNPNSPPANWQSHFGRIS